MIPPETLAALKNKGTLQAYILAHEGETRPRVIGEGVQRLTWGKKVIEKLSKVVKAGTKFFKAHGVTNSHEGREPIGEVLFSTLKDIGGKLANLVIGHFPDSMAVKPFDVISMEAGILTEADGQTVGDIEEVTGIAMASSNEESPAFPGAVRLAAVQCFESDSKTLEKGKEHKMTFEEVRQAVRDMNIFPHQLFDENTMKADKEFGKLYDKISTLSVDLDRVNKEKDEIEAKSKDVLKKSAISEAGQKLEALMQEGFTDKQKAYIKKTFNPESLPEINDTTLKQFIEQGKKDYSEMAKLFSEAEQTAAKAPQGETKSGDSIKDAVSELLEEAGA